MATTTTNTTTNTATLTVRRINGALGAEVSGVDLRRPVPDDVAEEMRRALDEHQVLVFRGQDDITEDQQIAVTTLFGHPGGAEPFRTFGELNAAGMSVASTQQRTPESPPFTNEWHTDISFSMTPPIVGTLCAPLIPKVGGDTAFVSLYSIYEGMSEPMQGLCEELQGEHSWEPMRKTFIEPRGPEYVAKAEAAFPPAHHPLVRTHPGTGRKLIFLGGERGTWMQGIVGLHPDEAEILLAYLQRQLDNIEYQFRWHWSPGDFLIWDERSTNHMGLGDHFEHDPYRTVRSVWAYEDDAPA